MIVVFYRMVKFNYSRLFKHWSAYVLYGMVVVLIVAIGYAPKLSQHGITTYTLYAAPSSYQEISRDAVYLNKQANGYSQYEVKKIQSRNPIALSQNSAVVTIVSYPSKIKVTFHYANITSRNISLENGLLNILATRYMQASGIHLPQISIVDLYKDHTAGIPDITKILIIFTPYLFALVFGTMIYIAVSIESIDKIMYLLLTKVSVYSIIYSKIVAVLAFAISLGILAAISLFGLNAFHLIEFSQILSTEHLTMSFIGLYIGILILGILQIIMLFTLFALSIKESSQLQTGMMIPGFTTAVCWGVGYWVLLFQVNTSAIQGVLSVLQLIPIVNIFTTIAYLGNQSLSGLDLTLFMIMTAVFLWGSHIGIRKIFNTKNTINL